MPDMNVCEVVLNESRGISWQEGDLTFTEVIRQQYSNCVFSAGMVEGDPVDTMYLRLERNGHVDTFLLLRPDEMAAIGWLAAGCLWSCHIGPKEESDETY